MTIILYAVQDNGIWHNHSRGRNDIIPKAKYPGIYVKFAFNKFLQNHATKYF